jgi:hypothetical protein
VASLFYGGLCLAASLEIYQQVGVVAQWLFVPVVLAGGIGLGLLVSRATKGPW